MLEFVPLRRAERREVLVTCIYDLLPFRRELKRRAGKQARGHRDIGLVEEVPGKDGFAPEDGNKTTNLGLTFAQHDANVGDLTGPFRVDLHVCEEFEGSIFDGVPLGAVAGGHVQCRPCALDVVGVLFDLGLISGGTR